MDIKAEGQKLLDFHSNLYEHLIKIPEKRGISYREDNENGNIIGKPRFEKSLFKWSSELLKDVHDHLQNIWDFFDRHSYWFDDTIVPLISNENRRNSKNSIIFLLENDIWCTDAVYGDYLIEKFQDKTIISYFRRDKKIKQFRLKIKDDSKIKEWICSNALRQVKEQFEFLWSKLETEIKVCIDEKFHQQPKIFLTSDYFLEQLKKAEKISTKWPEAALLSLGRIAELWLLVVLEKETSFFHADIIRDAEIEGTIDKHESKLLRKIKRYYNKLKHNPTYRIENEIVSSLIDEFSSIFCK